MKMNLGGELCLFENIIVEIVGWLNFYLGRDSFCCKERAW